MEVAKEGYYSLEDVAANIKAFMRYLALRWWLLLIVIAVSIAFAFLYFKNQKPKYEAVSTFILEEKTSSNGLAGLASQIGINVGGLSGGGGIFAGDNILDILKSKKVVRKVLLSPLENKPADGVTLADYYLNFSGTRTRWKKNEKLNGIKFTPDLEKLSPLQDSVLNVIYDHIVAKNLTTERLAETGTIIKVQVTAADGLFARLMTERLVDEASKLYLNIRTGTATDNIRQMQRRSDSLLALLNNRSYRAAASQPLDINPGIKTAFVPVEIATRDKAVLATLYTEVTKNLEASKMLLSQQTPVIQLLDQPGLLLDDNKKSLVLLVLLFTIGAFVIYSIVALVFFILFSSVRKKEGARF